MLILFGWTGGGCRSGSGQCRQSRRHCPLLHVHDMYAVHLYIYILAWLAPPNRHSLTRTYTTRYTQNVLQKRAGPYIRLSERQVLPPTVTVSL